MKIFLKKKKKKKQQYARERYKNISEDEKQKLFEYRKKYCRMIKKGLLQLQFKNFCFFIRKVLETFFFCTYV